MFYGEVGAIFEVGRYLQKKNWWWSQEGKLMDTGWHWYEKPRTQIEKILKFRNQISQQNI
jgi:hypothetical protein